MSYPLPLALDAMGGDNAPRAVVQGVVRALKKNPELRFLLFGDQKEITKCFKWDKKARLACQVIHTADVIAMDEKPSIALRKGKNSSMYMAIQAVKDGQASAMISAGNTGALMGISSFVLRTLPAISRPAFAAFVPARDRDVVMLDLGANVEATAEQLFQFAIMGEAYARTVLRLSRPRIAILNVGTEEVKGHEEVKEAAQMLRDTPLPLQFHGFVEGTDVTKGTVDVVVTDGFTGNIALKIMEGTARLMSHSLKEAIESSFWAKLGYLMSRSTFKKLKKKMDPRDHNGAMLLGLNGIIVKSHGGADAYAYANAINVAHDLVSDKINTRIVHELSAINAQDNVTPLRPEHSTDIASS